MRTSSEGHSSPHGSASPSNGQRPNSRRNNEKATKQTVRPRRSADERGRNLHLKSQVSTATQSTKEPLSAFLDPKTASPADMSPASHRRRARLRSPWSCSFLTLFAAFLAAIFALTIARSFLTRQLDPKGCAMSYMRPSWAKFPDFDTEHTRFASKYSLYLYREAGIDEDTRVKGIPVLFIPGNAGSYKQVRPLAAEAAVYFHEFLANDEAIRNGKRPLDWFTVDFNEDITAFHGQTLLDQAEYLNEAVSYILALYHNPNRSIRDPDLPDPASVILVGHSMGGIVARTMMTMPNYQSSSVNTILTLATPHSRAPVSFDAEIVHTYARVNQYWRQAFTQKWNAHNPLWHVSIVSISGGSLDTMISPEHASMSSLVPPTHGFTVFTSGIPDVWTSMDHVAITWCDQMRKSVVKALYDIVDASRPSQTRTRLERMALFKKRFLTGMEDVVERSLLQQEPNTLLTLEDNSNAIISQGERLVLRELGTSRKSKAHLLPIPPRGSKDTDTFSLLTNEKMDTSTDQAAIEVMLCTVFPLHAGQSSEVFAINMDLSGDTSGSTRLACKSTTADVMKLPASTRNSVHPFDDATPFSYLQYNLDQLSDHQFVAIIDKLTEPKTSWVIAEFAARSQQNIDVKGSLPAFLSAGLSTTIPATCPLMSQINIPYLSSSLLAYRLSIGKQSCKNDADLFMPLLRQHISDPYESKYFVNVKRADISLHGVSPYMPPAIYPQNESKGLSLQIWSDPTCKTPTEISMEVDLIGSMGKLWMRYRTMIAAFPLLIVAMVLRKQFQLYDQSGLFISFSESMDQSLRRSVPLLFVGLTLLGISLSSAAQTSAGNSILQRTVILTDIDFTKNDLLLGSQDPFFWFLVPLFGLVSVGTCIALNYSLLTLTHIFAVINTKLSKALSNGADARILNTFASASLRKRIITSSVLLLLVSTVIPYQFVYVVLCIVQIATCVRALSLARETQAGENINFYNYIHSILVLMIWILPINIPVLVVWMHNLAVHWLTPFSSHHNILSIMPFVLLVEIQSTGRMIPQMTTWTRHLNSVLFFGFAVYSAVYGITYAYVLHFIVNFVFVWLIIVHLKGHTFSLKGFTQAFDRQIDGVKKIP